MTVPVLTFEAIPKAVRNCVKPSTQRWEIKISNPWSNGQMLA